MGMNETQIIKTRKVHGHILRTLVTHQVEEASVEDLDQSQRWFRTVGHLVVSVRRVRTSVDSADHPSKPENRYWHRGFEVTFECGAVGFVSVYRNDSELDALVVGRKGYLHGLAVWKKYGRSRGLPVPWAMTKRSPRAYLNPDRLPRTCAAELYARAAGAGDDWGPTARAQDADRRVAS